MNWLRKLVMKAVRSGANVVKEIGALMNLAIFANMGATGTPCFLQRRLTVKNSLTPTARLVRRKWKRR